MLSESVCWGGQLAGPWLDSLTMDESFEFPAAARAKRYRGLAVDARREAQRAAGQARSSYLILAGQWDRLAIQAEKPALLGAKPGQSH